MKILIVNGPNLNLLGEREPGVYGTQTLQDLEKLVRSHAEKIGAQVSFFQSNHEGELIDTLQDARLAYDGIVYNPGAHTHYSYALRDCVAAIRIPVIETHISDIDSREEFRRVSVIAPACAGQVKGLGFGSYIKAMDMIAEILAGRGGGTGAEEGERR